MERVIVGADKVSSLMQVVHWYGTAMDKTQTTLLIIIALWGQSTWRNQVLVCK